MIPPQERGQETLERQALDLLSRALDQPEAQRIEWLRSVCDEQSALFERVRQLLQREHSSADFLTDGPGLPVEALTPRDRSGERLGAFELRELLAVGGMSMVYRGRRADGRFRQDVAIKVIRTDFADPQSLERFHAERQILASLEHPGIARLIDGGSTAAGESYVVMEYIDGVPVTEYCHRHALALEPRLHLFQKICSALQAAHEKGVVHRDIKAGNILVGSDEQPRIIDFGIAKVLSPDRRFSAGPETRVDRQLLTPEYASPEQVRGQAITPSSDVYSLGILLYELVTGERPYRVITPTPSLVERLVCHTIPADPSRFVTTEKTDPQPGLGSPRELSRRLRGDLDRIIMTALRKTPRNRYASARDLSEEIERHLDGRPVQARGASRWYRAGKFVRRYPVGVAAVSFALLVLTASTLLLNWQAREAERQRDLAQAAAARAESAQQFLTEMIQRTDPYENAESASLLGALKQSIPEIETRFAGQPELEADMRYAVGYALQNLGEVAPARTQLEQAWELRRQHGDDLDRAEALDGLGIIGWWESDFEYGERQFELALGWLQGELDERGQRLKVNVLSNWAAMLIDAGAIEKSRDLSRQALEIAENSDAIDIQSRISIWSNLATAEEGMEDFDAALDAFDRALRMQREATGEMHPSYAIILNNLAILYYRLERLGEAEAALEQSVHIRRETLGTAHPQTATALFNLARTESRMGEFDEAEQHAREALQVAQNGYPPGHPRIGKAHESLGIVLSDSGQIDAARAQFEQALTIYRSASSVNPDWIAATEQLQAGLAEE